MRLIHGNSHAISQTDHEAQLVLKQDLLSGFGADDVREERLKEDEKIVMLRALYAAFGSLAAGL